MSETILDAARQLERAWQVYDDLDRALIGLDRVKEKGAAMHRLESQLQTAYVRQEALFDLIAAKPARNASDAVVQIALASSLLDPLRDSDDEDDRRTYESQASRLLSSALRALVRETGINVEEHGLCHYASFLLEDNHWPEALEG